MTTRIMTEFSTYEVDEANSKFKLLVSDSPKDTKVHDGNWIEYHSINKFEVGGTLDIFYTNPVTKMLRGLSSSKIRSIVTL